MFSGSDDSPIPMIQLSCSINSLHNDHHEKGPYGKTGVGSPHQPRFGVSYGVTSQPVNGFPCILPKNFR